MAELADAADSKSAGLRPLGVRLPLPAPWFSFVISIIYGSQKVLPRLSILLWKTATVVIL
jgi:hypothetical protein